MKIHDDYLKFLEGKQRLEGRERKLEELLLELYNSVQEMRMHGDSQVQHVDGPTRSVLREVEEFLGVR